MVKYKEVFQLLGFSAVVEIPSGPTPRSIDQIQILGGTNTYLNNVNKYTHNGIRQPYLVH